MELTFNGEVLTPETIEKTRKSFADNQQACIDEVKSGKVRVNDPEDYFKWRLSMKKQYLEGTYKISLTFLQEAYYIQTGKSIALLP